MKRYTAKNLRVEGTSITLDILGIGTITAVVSLWGSLISAIGGEDKISKVKLLGDLLEFPNDVHVELEDFVTLAEKQNKFPVAGYAQRIEGHYERN